MLSGAKAAGIGRSKLGGTWIMRPSLVLGISALLAMLSLGAPAKADGSNFDVAASKGQVTVTPHSGWHINLDYSWSLKKGDDKVKAKGDFKLAKEAASVSGVAP